MRIRLTARNVETLQARNGKRTDYVDTTLPCFRLRVTPNGARSYAVAVTQNGRKRRINLGPIARLELTEARERARAVISALDRAEEPPPAVLPAGDLLTVAGLVRRCLDNIKLRPSTRVEWERLEKTEIVPVLGPRRAGELRRADVRDWLRTIRSRSYHTARHAHELLRRCYSWGVREDLVEASPCVGIEVERGPSGDRVLSAEELWALQRALDRGARPHRPGVRTYPEFASATRLLLLTGVRRSAVLGLRRDELHDLDGKEPRWVIPAVRSKSGRAHVVPLAPAAVALVKARLEAVPTQHLYPLGHGKKRQDQPMLWAGRWRSWLRWRLALAFNARRRVAGLPPIEIPRWRIHDLRHTVATHLREDLGVRADVVSLLLGHAVAGPRVSRVYDRAELLPERRAALDAWVGLLREVTCTRIGRLEAGGQERNS